MMYDTMQNHSSCTCNLHPEEQFTAFCSSCLCERLSTLNPPFSASRTSKSSSSFFPNLLRSKSFSSSKRRNSSATLDPQRRSCDIRARIAQSDHLGFAGANEHESRVSEEITNEADAIGEIVNQIIVEEGNEAPIRQNTDLKSQNSIKGIRSAASLFSKKLQSWRHKQKVEQSRVSFDDFRYSFDEPRASCDGHHLASMNRSRSMRTVASAIAETDELNSFFAERKETKRSKRGKGWKLWRMISNRWTDHPELVSGDRRPLPESWPEFQSEIKISRSYSSVNIRDSRRKSSEGSGGDERRTRKTEG